MSKNPNKHFIEFAKLVSEAGKLASKNVGGLEADLTALLIILGNDADEQLRKEAKVFRDSNGRPVCDLEVGGSGCDAYVESATYDDDGSEVSDDELDYLTETYPEYVQECAFESAICAAEYAFEGER